MEKRSISIVKSSGNTEFFSLGKYMNSLRHSGLSDTEIEQVVQRIEPQLFEGMTTRQLYQMTLPILKKIKRYSATLYNLREALRLMGPTGFPFEKLVAKILHHQGYTVATDQIMRGKCINHEIDIVAQKDNKTVLVECKFHNAIGNLSAVQTSLYVKARFDDIRAVNVQPIDRSLIVTNTRFSSEAIQYAACVGLELISWQYPHDACIEFYIERYKLYPITVLIDLSKRDRQTLFNSGIFFCIDLVNYHGKLDIAQRIFDRLEAESAMLCK